MVLKYFLSVVLRIFCIVNLKTFSYLQIMLADIAHYHSLEGSYYIQFTTVYSADVFG